MKNAEVMSWDGKTIQDVTLSVIPVQDPKIELDEDGRQDAGQGDIVEDEVEEEIDLECEDWIGSIEADTAPTSPMQRPGA